MSMELGRRPGPACATCTPANARPSRARGTCQNIPPVIGLAASACSCNPSEVLAIIGDTGAGKVWTLISGLSGALAAERPARFSLDGVKVNCHEPDLAPACRHRKTVFP